MLTVTTESLAEKVHVNRKPVFPDRVSCARRPRQYRCPHERRRPQAARGPNRPRTRKPRRKRRSARSIQRSARSSRKATLARAHAIATAREMADTVLPRYKVDASGDLVPDVRAAAAIIYNPETNQVLWEENSQAQRSIASITKVMTATVFLENNPDLTQPVTIDRSDVFQASTTHLRANDRLGDDGRPAAPAADRVGQRRGARARARLAVRLGRLRSPHEREGRRARSAEHALRGPVRSAVRERLVGLRHGAAHHARVGRRADRVGHADPGIHRPHGEEPRDHVPQHESPARPADVDVRAGKTGFISKAGYCLATLLRLRRASAASRSRSSSSARGRTPAASWRRRTCSTGSPPRRRRSSRPSRTDPANRKQTNHVRVRGCLYPIYPRCIAAASSGSVAIESTDTITGRDAWRASYALR